jgi:hypothetical protein
VPHLVWTPEALDDLQTIVAYIADRNPVAAENETMFRENLGRITRQKPKDKPAQAKKVQRRKI